MKLMPSAYALVQDSAWRACEQDLLRLLPLLGEMWIEATRQVACMEHASAQKWLRSVAKQGSHPQQVIGEDVRPVKGCTRNLTQAASVLQA